MYVVTFSLSTAFDPEVIWISMVQVVICTEEYTSKTCGSCGYIHKKLGGSKEFCCPQCKTNLDRDINGARNILLRYLTKRKMSQLRLTREPISLQDLLLLVIIGFKCRRERFIRNSIKVTSKLIFIVRHCCWMSSRRKIQVLFSLSLTQHAFIS